jgi:leucyl/phenylalanyl-tRNA--protein transferase
MRHCSQPRQGDPDTWISEEIINAYTDLHKLGMAYSVETYIDNRLVGGVYGVSIGAAFFGESMFHLVPNASKVAFHYLVQTLKRNDYQLLDTQFMNDNVKRFGAIEIPKATYLLQLKAALSKRTKFVEADFDHIFS